MFFCSVSFISSQQMSIAFVYFYNLLPFQLRQLRFHLRDQHLQLLLAFLARMRIHIPRVLFAVDPCRGISPLKEVVVDLADAACAGFADLAHIGLEVDDGGRICLRRRLVWKFCLSDAAVDLPRGGVLHVGGNVRIDVQRCGRRHMPQHGGERFHVHPILQRQGRKRMPLRYNYDKPEKPRISRVFGYLARFFILFQTEKSSREVVIS